MKEFEMVGIAEFMKRVGINKKSPKKLGKTLLVQQTLPESLLLLSRLNKGIRVRKIR